MTTTVIFDNSYHHTDWYEEARMLLAETHEGKEISESQIWEEAGWLQNEHWDLEKGQLVEYFGDSPVLFAADIGRWDGHYRCGRIGNFEEVLDDFLDEMDSFSVIDDDGHLFVNAYHYDGCNSAEVMIIGKEGIDKVWEKFEVDLDHEEISDREIHDFLEKAQELKAPCFANKVYGTPLTQ